MLTNWIFSIAISLPPLGPAPTRPEDIFPDLVSVLEGQLDTAQRERFFDGWNAEDFNFIGSILLRFSDSMSEDLPWMRAYHVDRYSFELAHALLFVGETTSRYQRTKYRRIIYEPEIDLSNELHVAKNRPDAVVIVRRNGRWQIERVIEVKLNGSVLRQSQGMGVYERWHERGFYLNNKIHISIDGSNEDFFHSWLLISTKPAGSWFTGEHQAPRISSEVLLAISRRFLLSLADASDIEAEARDLENQAKEQKKKLLFSLYEWIQTHGEKLPARRGRTKLERRWAHRVTRWGGQKLVLESMLKDLPDECHGLVRSLSKKFAL